MNYLFLERAVSGHDLIRMREALFGTDNRSYPTLVVTRFLSDGFELGGTRECPPHRDLRLVRKVQTVLIGWWEINLEPH